MIDENFAYLNGGGAAARLILRRYVRDSRAGEFATAIDVGQRRSRNRLR